METLLVQHNQELVICHHSGPLESLKNDGNFIHPLNQISPRATLYLMNEAN